MLLFCCRSFLKHKIRRMAYLSQSKYVGLENLYRHFPLLNTPPTSLDACLKSIIYTPKHFHTPAIRLLSNLSQAPRPHDGILGTKFVGLQNLYLHLFRTSTPPHLLMPASHSFHLRHSTLTSHPCYYCRTFLKHRSHMMTYV